MIKLENLQAGSQIRGIVAGVTVTIKSVQWHGNAAVEVIYTDPTGALDSRLLYPHDEASLEPVAHQRPWSFDGDGDLLRLVSEAHRIRMAWLFDPYVAISSATIEPYPHQISAVYEEMLQRQPMRFLLADDPGAGKTIMAGLLIKELILRGDLERCLIIAPGSLTDQWQDELHDKFQLDFEALTRDMIQSTRHNPFDRHNLLVARMDQLKSNQDALRRLTSSPEWDLVIVDEAHRMSGHVVGRKVEYTKRYRLGEIVGKHCRNFLLMTATPHNGKDEDFHIFMSLLDADRFAGLYRKEQHQNTDTSDLMRRFIKEDLRRFDGEKLFPERFSYTPQYELSPPEKHLYDEVTEYVRQEMNHAERLAGAEAARRVNVTFALMTLQRRLASSPLSILRSLERRRQRLQDRLADERASLARDTVAEHILRVSHADTLRSDWEDWDDIYDEAPQDERETLEQTVVDLATAAQTVAELETEIARLVELEALAREVKDSSEDAKWLQLSEILDHPLMRDEQHNRRKLVIFTEFVDTLKYLSQRIRKRLGRDDAVVEIHGKVKRKDRLDVIAKFMNDPEVLVLVANDAAGEGVNLQRAHLMVNYDLPWNPNRLEQRFGRIHRIGQKQKCHLWNLVAQNTREGGVYASLLKKLENESEALGGKVFDVLGQMFENRPLRELLMDAVCANDPSVEVANIKHEAESIADHQRLIGLLERRALVQGTMDMSKIKTIHEDMERARARRMQPHVIESFFVEALPRLGGRLRLREPGRYHVHLVPKEIRERRPTTGSSAPVQARYERVCFDKGMIGDPVAYLVCPGSALLDSVIEMLIERHGDVLHTGAVLIDDNDPGDSPRLLFYVEQAVQDGRRRGRGPFQIVSRRWHFIEVDAPVGDTTQPVLPSAYRLSGQAPYIDYRSPSESERSVLDDLLSATWLDRDWQSEVLTHAITTTVPAHVQEVRTERLPIIDKTEDEVRARLQKEINHWDRQAADAAERERAGKKPRQSSQKCQLRADTLAARLRDRTAELQLERNLSPQPPVLRGGALIVPRGLLERMRSRATGDAESPTRLEDAAARARVEQLAMAAVAQAERDLGREPKDVHHIGGLGYDFESRDPATGDLYFIEVKGRTIGNEDVSLQNSQILCARNVPDRFRLAIVLIESDRAQAPVYVRDFNYGQPSFAQTSASFRLRDLLAASEPPC